MDQLQHQVQDACEAYAVALLQELAEEQGVAISYASSERWQEFYDYLDTVGVSCREFENGEYSQYKHNAKKHLPRFIQRLRTTFPAETFNFINVETAYRNMGLKADFLIIFGDGSEIPVSLKNYIGSTGIGKPQVASGTFNSFVLSFIFEREGPPGCYRHPGTGMRFKGSVREKRDEALRAKGRKDLVPLMHELDSLQEQVRDQFLSSKYEFHDEEAVSEAAERLGMEGVSIALRIFDRLDVADIRHEFLKRIGLDGAEEALFFDSRLYTDSITHDRYRDLRRLVNDHETDFRLRQHGKAIAFEFVRDGNIVLGVKVPFTINTNGAWHRPKKPFEGAVRYVDLGNPVWLKYGQRRPYKSRQISTSINTYMNLRKTGIFD